MPASLRFVHLDTPDSLLPAFDVMRQLRPHLTDAHSFAAQVARQHAEGYRLLAASDAGSVVGLAGYRTLTNLLYGRFGYVDDLVVDDRLQRGGIGTQLLGCLRHGSGGRHARSGAGCNSRTVLRWSSGALNGMHARVVRVERSSGLPGRVSLW